MRGLYIHIPFCVSKCAYCDFNSYAGKEKYMGEYVTALLKEASGFKDEAVDTIYIGGGTPTTLPQQEMERLVFGLNDIFKIPQNAEFTVEMNPCTADYEYLKAINSAGVNRISMGAQSFDDTLLKILGRKHRAEDVSNSVTLCREAGFENISMDLMFSLPNQTFEDWQNTLEKAILCKPDHISCYGLKIEEGTPFYDRGIEPLPEELDRKMYHYAIEFLGKYGYNQYEISNFAQPGKESRHNLKYWRCEEYFGLGAGAHCYLDGVRKYNVAPIDAYIKRIKETSNATEEETVLTAEDVKVEKIIMGLRLKEGINAGLIKDADIYLNAGFMESVGENIRFTTKGFDVSNEILSKLI